jgi:hypothetical protein
MLDNIVNLSSIGMSGSFGTRNEDLILLIISATLMFAGPALFSAFYLMSQEVKDHFKPKPLPLPQLAFGLSSPKHA